MFCEKNSNVEPCVSAKKIMYECGMRDRYCMQKKPIICIERLCRQAGRRVRAHATEILLCFSFYTHCLLESGRATIGMPSSTNLRSLLVNPQWIHGSQSFKKPSKLNKKKSIGFYFLTVPFPVTAYTTVCRSGFVESKTITIVRAKQPINVPISKRLFNNAAVARFIIVNLFQTFLRTLCPQIHSFSVAHARYKCQHIPPLGISAFITCWSSALQLMCVTLFCVKVD